MALAICHLARYPSTFGGLPLGSALDGLGSLPIDSALMATAACHLIRCLAAEGVAAWHRAQRLRKLASSLPLGSELDCLGSLPLGMTLDGLEGSPFSSGLDC